LAAERTASRKQRRRGECELNRGHRDLIKYMYVQTNVCSPRRIRAFVGPSILKGIRGSHAWSAAARDSITFVLSMVQVREANRRPRPISGLAASCPTEKWGTRPKLNEAEPLKSKDDMPLYRGCQNKIKCFIRILNVMDVEVMTIWSTTQV
jgi:hypothetical protein